MVQTTDFSVSGNDLRKFRKNSTATPCPGNPTEGIECQNFMLKNGVFGVNPIIQGSKYNNLKTLLYTVQEHPIVYLWSKFQVNWTRTSLTA